MCVCLFVSEDEWVRRFVRGLSEVLLVAPAGRGELSRRCCDPIGRGYSEE